MKTQPWNGGPARSYEAPVSPTAWMQTPFVFHGPSGAPLQLEIITATYQAWSHILAAKSFTLKLLGGEIVASLQGGQLEVHEDFKPAIAMFDHFVDVERRAAVSDVLARLERSAEANATHRTSSASEAATADTPSRAVIDPVESGPAETRALQQGDGRVHPRPESHRRRR